LTNPTGLQRLAWLTRGVAALFALSLTLVLVLAVVWTTRGFAVFNYTEGVILGSLAGFRASGLTGLYPADWTSAPLVLTLYPPVFFWATIGMDAISNAADPLVAPRLVSLVATLGLGWCLVRIRRLFGTDWTWFIIVAGAVSLAPGVQRQLAAAQVDMLAVAWTVAGAWFALRSGMSQKPVWPAFACFAIAVFTKQSFVAAPAALLLSRYLSGRRKESLREGAAFAGIVAGGFLLLNGWTSGGFFTHTLTAVTDSGSVVNFVRVIDGSAPYLWGALALLVLSGVHDRLQLAFPELWLAMAAILHTGAMLKTGSSVNYFLEPLAAVLVLGLVRSAEAPWAADRSSQTRRIALGLLVVLVAGSAIRTVEVVRDITRASGADPIHVAEFEGGFPLVEVDFFPAIFEHGGRPYVSDPFAFGALAESGVWDPAPLVADLASHRVPFAVTTIDIGPPLGDGATTENMLFAYFWRMAPVRDGLRSDYTEVTGGRLRLWVPRDGED